MPFDFQINFCSDGNISEWVTLEVMLRVQQIAQKIFCLREAMHSITMLWWLSH